MYIEKIYELINKTALDKEDIVEHCQKLTDYVSCVIMHGIQTEKAKVWLDAGRITQEDFISKIEKLNDDRNKKHTAACMACFNINAIAERNRLGKVFNFELELIYDDYGRMLGCSQNNHYTVNTICAQFVNEFYENGIHEYNVNLMDQIVENHKEPLQGLTQWEIFEKGLDWTQNLEVNIKDSIRNNITNYVCKDGLVIDIINNVDGYSVDVQLTGKSNISEMTGFNSFYFDGNGNGKDVPISVIEDIIKRHGGLIERRNNLDIER